MKRLAKNQQVSIWCPYVEVAHSVGPVSQWLDDVGAASAQLVVVGIDVVDDNHHPGRADAAIGVQVELGGVADNGRIGRWGLPGEYGVEPEHVREVRSGRLHTSARQHG